MRTMRDHLENTKLIKKAENLDLGNQILFEVMVQKLWQVGVPLTADD